MEMYHTPSDAPWVVSHKPIAVEAGLGHMAFTAISSTRIRNFVLLARCSPSSMWRLTITRSSTTRASKQAVRRSVPGPRYRTRRLVQLLLLLDPQLPRISRRLLDWSSRLPMRGRPRLSSRVNEGETRRCGRAWVRAKLQIGILHGGFPAARTYRPYLQDKQRHLKEVVRPLQSAEPVYVVKGSDADDSPAASQEQDVKPISSGPGRAPSAAFSPSCHSYSTEPVQVSMPSSFQITAGGARGDHHHQNRTSTSRTACLARPFASRSIGSSRMRRVFQSHRQRSDQGRPAPAAEFANASVGRTAPRE
jgi:hypothetical protein